MLATVMVTFEEREEFFIRAVLREIKRTVDFNVKRIALGQFFDKRAASIIMPEKQMQNIFDKLTANEICIYPFDNESRTKIKETKDRITQLGLYKEDKIRAEYFRTRRQLGFSSLNSEREEKRTVLPKSVKAVPKEIREQLKEFDTKLAINEPLDAHVKEGNYIAIRNMIKNNPLQNEKIKEKYIPAIKSSIQIQLERGLKNDSYVDESLKKLKDIICDPEIKAIKTEDFVGLAGDALINVCSSKDNEELVSIANLPSIGQKLNVMAAVKLTELIFEKDNSVNEELLKYASTKINRRFLLTSFDVVEPSISELNKSRFNLLINSIQDIAA